MAKCKQCGRGGLGQKLHDGLCVECLSAALAKVEKEKEDVGKELDKIRASITPEMKDALELEQIIKSRKKEIAHLDDAVQKGKEEIRQRSADLASLNRQILVAEETVELESFSLYRPRYDFANSEQYKAKLDSIRDAQKQMLKNKSATTAPTNWVVNNSKTEGKKMVADNVKLFLRSFNNECDIAVSAVKFNNFDKCRERIIKSFESINKLGRVTSIQITASYKKLKLDELSLAYEYQCKKQEEKEQLRALREQQREEAKLAKEIEAARKEAEKEKKHYQQALEKLKVQYAACRTDEEKAALVEKQNELIGYLDDISAKLEDIDYRQANQRAGYVYIISNIGSFGEGIYKIGMTRRLDPMERVYELGDASVPFMFDVHAMIFSDDAPKLEAALHQAFADRRVNMVNNRREYFRVSLAEIKKVVLANHDKTVEFVESPEAQQYRETMLIKSASSVDLQQAKGA